MYSEIQSLITFLTNFLYGKIPRRKVNLWGEQLANFLAQKFGHYWFPGDPHHQSGYRRIRVNVDSQMDPLISLAADVVGLELDELMKCLPTELTIWVNPGEVTYRLGQYGTLQFIYSARDMNNTILNRLLCPVTPMGVGGIGGGVSGSNNGTTGAGATVSNNDASLPTCQLRLTMHGQQFMAGMMMMSSNSNINSNGSNKSVGGTQLITRSSSTDRRPTSFGQFHGTGTINPYHQQQRGSSGGGLRLNASTGALYDAAPGGMAVMGGSGISDSPQHSPVTPVINLTSAPIFELVSPNEPKFNVAQFAQTRFGTTKLKSAPAAVGTNGNSTAAGNKSNSSNGSTIVNKSMTNTSIGGNKSNVSTGTIISNVDAAGTSYANKVIIGTGGSNNDKIGSSMGNKAGIRASGSVIGKKRANMH